MEKVATSRIILYLMTKRQTAKLRFFKASSQLEYWAVAPWRYQSARYQLCSCSPPASAALMVQGCIKHSTSPNISWSCTYSKYRTELPGFHDLQQPSPLMVNAEIKVFPCGSLNFFCYRKGLSLLRHGCKLHFHLAPKMVCTDLLYSGTIPFAAWRRTDTSGVLQIRVVAAGAVQEDVTGYHSIRLLQQFLKLWIILSRFS